MEEILSQQNILFVLGLMGILFGVYHYFKNPQINSEKQDALLAQKVQWEREANDKKFTELAKRLDDSFLLASNHVHTVDVKVETLNQSVVVMSNRITELATIINERIPKK